MQLLVLVRMLLLTVYTCTSGTSAGIFDGVLCDCNPSTSTLDLTTGGPDHPAGGLSGDVDCNFHDLLTCSPCHFANVATVAASGRVHRLERGEPTWILDSGCESTMTSQKFLLTDVRRHEQINDPAVTVSTADALARVFQGCLERHETAANRTKNKLFLDSNHGMPLRYTCYHRLSKK